MKTKRKSFSCDFCDGRVESRVIRAPFHFRRRTIYVDHVPAWVCGQCGERYYDAPVVRRLEEIARRRKSVKSQITFPLADYQMVL